jgi:O-antigen/teichoic acid export membrane protein
MHWREHFIDRSPMPTFTNLRARVVRSAWRSPTLRAVGAITMGGAAFAIGNLLLARALPQAEYGRFALVLAIITIGIATGPLGANVIVNRQPVNPGRRLFIRTLTTSSIVAVGLTIVAGALYPLEIPLLAVMLTGIVAGAAKLVTVGHYQSRRRYGFSLWLFETTNLSVLVAGVAAVTLHSTTALAPATVLAICLWGSSAYAWWRVLKDRAALQYPEPPFPWGDALSVVGAIGAAMVLLALERLVIPRTLGLQALATFSVLATLVGSPFQVLSQGVGFTLLPSLRAAAATERRRVLVQETLAVLGMCLFSAMVVWWFTPIALHLFLPGRYELADGLIVAAIVVGTLKPVGTLAVGTVNALGSSRSLATLSVISWAAVLVGIGGAWLGAANGLTSLIYGAGGGWLLRAAATTWLAVLCLQQPVLLDQRDDALTKGLAEE